MMEPARFFLIALLCLFGTSRCVTSPYPDGWPEQDWVTAATCPNLTGAFQNRGESGDADSVLLAPIFFPIGLHDPLAVNYELSAVSRLSFETRSDTDVLVRAWVGDELYEERVITVDELPCREGRIIFRDTSWHANGVPPFLPVIYRTSIDRWLSITTDGSLIMENREVSAGAALVIPVGLKALYWFRFPAAALAASGSDTSSLPQGVRSEAVSLKYLFPPQNAPSWSGYGDAEACIERTVKAGGMTDPRAATLLQGRSTQSYLVQNGPEGRLVPTGTVVGNNWLPGTHGLRIEKLNWQVPAIADNYILCLLDKGYSMGDVEDTTPN